MWKRELSEVNTPGMADPLWFNSCEKRKYITFQMYVLFPLSALVVEMGTFKSKYCLLLS